MLLSLTDRRILARMQISCMVFSVDFNLYNVILLCSGLCFLCMATSYEMVLHVRVNNAFSIPKPSHALSSFRVQDELAKMKLCAQTTCNIVWLSDRYNKPAITAMI